MRAILILPILLMACGLEVEEAVEPDGCAQNPEITQVESKEICIDSMRCVQKGDVSFVNYMCVCDNICLCFYSHLSECESVFGDCVPSSSMLLMPSDFCLYPEKEMVLRELYRSTQEIMADE